MRNNDPSKNSNRRRILQASGASLLALVSSSGIASAKRKRGNRGPPGRSQGPPEHAKSEWVRVNHGRLEVAVEESKWDAPDPADIDGIPEKAEPIPHEALRRAVADANRAIADGRLHASERNGQPFLLSQESAFPGAEGENE